MSNNFLYNNNVINCIDSGVLVVDKDCRVHLWNQFMEIHSEFTENDILGLNLLQCFPDLPKQWFEKKIKSVLLLNHPAYTSWEQRPYLFQFSHSRSVTSGVENMYQNCCFTPIVDPANNLQYVCITVKDVTDNAISTIQLKQAYAELERLSSIDGLTQLYSRSHWEQRFINEVDRINRYGGQASLIIFDIDHFKKINDQYGHLCGDEVLRQVSKRCVDILRSVDIIGRYGGEEFTVFLPETDTTQTALVAEKLRKEMCDSPIYHESMQIFISISIGFTTSEATQNNHQSLLNEADIALYQAKANGRNQCVNYPK